MNALGPRTTQAIAGKQASFVNVDSSFRTAIAESKKMMSGRCRPPSVWSPASPSGRTRHGSFFEVSLLTEEALRWRERKSVMAV